MDPWLKQLVMSKNAEIVHEYDQTTDVRKGTGNENGWCNGMSAHWIRCKKNNVDFWTWFDEPGSAPQVRSVQTNARMINTAGGYNAAGQAAASMLGYAGISATANSDTFEASARALTVELSTYLGRGRFNIIGLHGSGGGHAMAAIWGSVDMTIMDPNAGEIAVSHGKSREFFSMFLTGMNYIAQYPNISIDRYD